MALPLPAWQLVASLCDGSELCRLASTSKELCSVSEEVVQRSLEAWCEWNPRPDNDDTRFTYAYQCLVEPATPYDRVWRHLHKLRAESLWRRYWLQAVSWWAIVG